MGSGTGEPLGQHLLPQPGSDAQGMRSRAWERAFLAICLQGNALAEYQNREEIIMQCNQCRTTIEAGDEHQHHGRILCEDCYMDALSPAKSCDPWAVHAAKSLEKHSGGAVTLTPVQTEILNVLDSNGSLEPAALLERLAGRLTRAQLEREFAALRHMEKARAEKRGDQVVLRVW
ncbi:MAG TPA: hypothetical protein DCE18_02730 [Syntrophobacteraceae bacterium]|nr:hypothetical protein [Syntrophobacteraceae bacterium]